MHFNDAKGILSGENRALRDKYLPSGRLFPDISLVSTKGSLPCNAGYCTDDSRSA